MKLKRGLPVKELCGIDGEATVMGKRSGLTAQVKELAPNSVST